MTGNDLIEDYRNHYRSRHGSDADFASVQPAYEYGYRYASVPEYSGRSWDDAEGDLRVFWSNPLVGSITTLAIILLFWPLIGRAVSAVMAQVRGKAVTQSGG